MVITITQVTAIKEGISFFVLLELKCRHLIVLDVDEKLHSYSTILGINLHIYSSFL